MKLFKNVGWWLPEHERHLQDWMLKKNDVWDGRLSYQGSKIRKALQLVAARGQGFRTAIDIGAHVGLWSFYLASRFERVEAFEPVDEHRLCFGENVHADNVTVHPFALGDASGKVGMYTEPSSSGDTYVRGKGDTEVRRLDTFGLSFVDFVKVDCEGYEYFALHGGEELLKACRPVVVVEQKPNKAQKYGLAETGAVTYLEQLGAKRVAEMGGDFYCIWPNQ